MARSLIVTVTLNTAVDRMLSVDGLAIGAHVQARLLHRIPAGKGINVSRALARLGCSSRAAGFVGAGEHEWFNELLRRSGSAMIQPHLTPVDGQTRENITLIDMKSSADLHVRGSGFVVGEAQLLRLAADLARMATPETLFVFSGSMPPGLSPDDFGHLLSDLSKTGAQIVVDTGGETLRTLFGASAPWRLRPWLVKPNAAELSQCLDEPLAEDLPTLAAQAASLRDRATWIAATAGAAGAVLVGPAKRWLATRQPGCDEPPKVSTVGCGDCFLAGLLAGWPQGPVAALRQAVAVGSANAAVAGAAEFDVNLAHSLAAAIAIAVSEHVG